jgi:hypothetical protein
VRAASRHYVGQNCNLDLLADSIEEHFQSEGYKTQSGKTDKGWVVQAKKEGLLRELVAADRAFTAVVSGQPADFEVAFGIGKWLTNLGMATLEGLLIAPLLFFVEIPVALWSYAIESQFWSFVDKEVELRV